MSGILNVGPAMEPFRLMYMTRDGVSGMKYPMDSTFGYLGHRPPRQAEQSRRIARWTSPQENPAERLATGKC